MLGLRPEDLEDASFAPGTPEDRRLSIVCDIREDMGSEVYVHFNVPADPGTTREVVVVDDAEDHEARLAAERERGGGVDFIARLERTTEARERQPLSLAVDVTHLHFFDPETGVGLDGSVA